jgi:hypothetical protein
VSLFHNSSCCGNTAGTTQRRSNGGGAVSEVLAALANRATDICAPAAQSTVIVIPRNTNVPLELAGTEGVSSGTPLTLVKYDPETYTAVFTFAGVTGALQTIVLDARCLCGIICVSG